MSGLEDQVNTLENQVRTLEHQAKDFEGKLSAAYLEVSTKENIVKQHTKVAEEAVSGEILNVEDSSILSLSSNHLHLGFEVTNADCETLGQAPGRGGWLGVVFVVGCVVIMSLTTILPKIL